MARSCYSKGATPLDIRMVDVWGELSRGMIWPSDYL